LNHGLHLIKDYQERLLFARLNLQAALAARKSHAFETGLSYAKAGIELLGENSWEQHYRLTLELEEQMALLAYMAGDIPCMKYYGRRVLESGKDPLDVVQVKKMHMEFLAGSKRQREAIDLGLQALEELGFELPAEIDWKLATTRVKAFSEHLDREDPDWLALPPLSDRGSPAGCGLRDPDGAHTNCVRRRPSAVPSDRRGLSGAMSHKPVSPP